MSESSDGLRSTLLECTQITQDCDHDLAISLYEQEALDETATCLHSALLSDAATHGPTTLGAWRFLHPEFPYASHTSLESLSKTLAAVEKRTQDRLGEQLAKAKRLNDNLQRAIKTLRENIVETRKDLKRISDPNLKITLITPALLYYQRPFTFETIERGSSLILEQMHNSNAAFSTELDRYIGRLESLYGARRSGFDTITNTVSRFANRGKHIYSDLVDKPLPDSKRLRLEISQDRYTQVLNTPQLYRPTSRYSGDDPIIEFPSKQFIEERVSVIDKNLEEMAARAEKTDSLIERCSNLIGKLPRWAEQREVESQEWTKKRLEWALRRPFKNYIGALARMEFYIYNYQRAYIRNIEQCLDT